MIEPEENDYTVDDIDFDIDNYDYREMEQELDDYILDSWGF